MGTRAKDSDRNDTCQVLDTALSEGQLSMEEHRQRVSAATTAATLGELQALVADLQTSNAPVQLPKLKSRNQIQGGDGWGMRIAVAAVFVVLGVGLGWGIFGSSNSPLAADPGAAPDGIAANTQAPPRLLHSANGLNGLFAQARKKWGDTMGYSLTIYPDYASMERADPNDARRTLRYLYRGGWDDNPSVSAISDGEKLVDLAKFDVNAIIGRLRGAPQNPRHRAIRGEVDLPEHRTEQRPDDTGRRGDFYLRVHHVREERIPDHRPAGRNPQPEPADLSAQLPPIAAQKPPSCGLG